MLHRFFGPNLFVEADPDPQNPDTVPSRRSGIEVPLTNALTGESAGTTTSHAGGFLYVELDDVPAIRFDTKRWDPDSSDYVDDTILALSEETTWLLFTMQDNTSQALSTAQDAKDIANQALQLSQSAGAKKVAGVSPDGAGNVPAGSLVTALGVLTAAQIATLYTKTADLATVAKTGQYDALLGKPDPGIPTTQKGAVGGVAELGPDGKVPTDQLPATIGSGTVQSVADVEPDEDGNVPLTPASIGAATAAQGTKADSAVQPADLDAYATDDDLDAYAKNADVTPILYDDGWPAVRRSSALPQVYNDVAEAVTSGADTDGPPTGTGGIVNDYDRWQTVIYE